MKLAVKLQTCVTKAVVYYFSSDGYSFCSTSIMKRNINPVNSSVIKEGARIECTLFEAR